MFRALLRLVVLVVILAVVAAFFLGYRWRISGPSERPVATVASDDAINRDSARQAGAKIADTVAQGANRAEQVLSDASLTTKITSKITLDDTLNGSRIDVDTNGTQVTLSGSVASEAQRKRAVQLARETEGVTNVTDRLAVASR